MTRPAGRRRLPSLCLALLCLCVLVARCGGDATAAVRLQAGQSPFRRSVARRFGLPRRLAQAEGDGAGGDAELDSSALAKEEESTDEPDLLEDSSSDTGLGESDSSVLGGGEGGDALDGSSDSSSDGLGAPDGDSDDLLESSDGLELFDDDEEDDDGFDWSSDLRLWGEEDGDDDDSDGFDALEDSALFSSDNGFDDDAYFDFWAEDDELPPDLGAPPAAEPPNAASARRRALSPGPLGLVCSAPPC